MCPFRSVGCENLEIDKLLCPWPVNDLRPELFIDPTLRLLIEPLTISLYNRVFGAWQLDWQFTVIRRQKT